MQLGYVFLWVADVAATVAFYEKAFGLQRRVMVNTGDNGWYAEIETGPTTLAIADAKEAEHLFPEGYHASRPDEVPGLFQLSFLTDDVPAAFQQVLAAGATEQMAPKTLPWGQTIARVRDPNGILVSLATPPVIPTQP